MLKRITERVHAVCWERPLSPGAASEAERGCRVERYAPVLMRIVAEIPDGTWPEYDRAIRSEVCRVCDEPRAGECAARREAECCLFRYAPLLIEDIAAARRAGRLD